MLFQFSSTCLDSLPHCFPDTIHDLLCAGITAQSIVEISPDRVEYLERQFPDAFLT